MDRTPVIPKIGDREGMAREVRGLGECSFWKVTDTSVCK